MILCVDQSSHCKQQAAATTNHQQSKQQASQTTHSNVHHQHHHQQQQHYLTIEELKLALNSCWLCGCNWQADHVSLDCPECGGYALTRPCPNCDGRCKQRWRRNITHTHDRHRAAWLGQCDIVVQDNNQKNHHLMKSNEIGATTSKNINVSAATNLAPRLASMSTTNTSSSTTGSTTAPTTPTTTTSIMQPMPASPSSCCSSHPSSAASSDSEDTYDDHLLMINK